MGWFSRRREQRSGTSGLAVPSEWLVGAFGSTPTPSGKRVTVQNALGLAPVWAAVSIISEQIGQLPLKVYRQLDEKERVEARQHRAWRLLHDRPNALTPAGRFWSTVTAQLLLWGNAFVEKRRDPLGLVDELWLLHPAQMVVKWDASTRTKTFEYEPGDGTGGRTYTEDQVLHIFGLSLDGLVGQSVIRTCRTSLGAALARDEFEGGFYKRGAVLSGVIEMPGRIENDAAKDRLKASVVTLFAGSEKSFGVGVFEEDAKFKPVGSPMKDLEFVAAQQLSRTDIAVMFKLPPHLLGGSTGDSLTYSTVESSQIQFALHAIAPWTHVIAEALTQDPSIMPQSVFDAEFVMEGMLRADAGSRSEFYERMVGMKAMTVNEVRARESLPPLPGGDKFPEPPAPQSPANGNGHANVDVAALVANGNEDH